MPDFAANLTMMFTELPFPERFAAAAAAGFTGVEFLFPYDYRPDEVAGWLRAAGLSCALFNLWPGDWALGERGLASLPGREAAFRASVSQALEYAEALGTPRLHAMAGVLPNGADRRRHLDTYVQNLTFAARALAETGRTLLIEAINPRDMPGYFLTTQAEAHAVRLEVGASNLLVQMDFYHAQMTEGRLAETFVQHADAIGHVQIAGVPGRHEPDRGEIDYAFLFELLDDSQYVGWVGCEYRPRGRTEEGLGWLRRWRERSSPRG